VLPGETIGRGFHEQGRKARHELAAIMIVEKDLPPFGPAPNDMLQ